MTAPIEEIPFRIPGADGHPIRGDLRLPADGPPRPLLVVCHGFKGFKDWGFFPYLCRSLADRGIPNAIFNFSHSGVGEDGRTFSRMDLFRRNTWSRELFDVHRVIDAAADGSLPRPDAYTRDRFRILGHSRGGGVAILAAAADERADRLATIASISRIDRFSEEVKRRWRENGFITVWNMRIRQEMPMDLAFLEDIESNREAYSIEGAVRSMRIPFLVIHGDRDESVPCAEADEIAFWGDPAFLKKVILPGVDHVLDSRHPFPGSSGTLESVISRLAKFLA